MKNNKKSKLCMFLLMGVLLISLASSYMSSDPKLTQIASQQAFGSFDKSMCEAGQDFIVQIAPFGCTPAVVRSDLLEEQNVPVFCQLSATKINPLINVEAIEHISFSGDYPKEVSGLGFHPAQSALGVSGDLNSPVMNNIGYAVIVLKKQKNSSAMPEFVQGNLTAKIRYDIENAFGIGQANFYLPEMSDDDWENKHVQYGFWNGKFYLRAQGVDEQGARISIYDDKKKISSTDLDKGETSNMFYLPGFDCLAGLKLKLEELEVPNTRAKLDINGDIVEVAEDERFLDNKCQIKKIDKNGLVQSVSINCKGDDKRETFSLSISPRVNLDFEGAKEDGYVVGDQLYPADEQGTKFVYLGYMGETSDGAKFIIPVVSPARNSDAFRQTQTYKKLPEIVKIVNFNSKNILLDAVMAYLKLGYGGILGITKFIQGGDYPVGWIYEDPTGQNSFGLEEYENPGKNPWKIAWNLAYDGVVKKLPFFEIILTNKIKFLGFTGPQDEELEKNIQENYESAIADYDKIINSFSGEKYSENSEVTLGEEASYKKIELAWDLNQKRTLLDFCEKFKEKYPGSEKNLKKYCDDEYKLANFEISNRDVLINGRVKRISFNSIYEPNEEEYSAEVEMTGIKKGERGEKDENLNIPLKMVKGVKYPLLGEDYVELVSLDEDSLIVKFNVDETLGQVAGSVLHFSGKNTKIKLNDYVTNIGKNNYKITLTKINLKKQARVSVLPNINNVGTEAKFGFKIGIEQRTIKLSPEKTKEKIEELNKQISKWEENSKKLGNVVKGLKTACLGVGAMLTIKNFLANTDGRAIARQSVMKGDTGWYKRCKDLVDKKEYASQESCLVGKADEIDNDVELYHNALSKQNDEIKKLQKSYVVEDSIFGKTIDTEKFTNAYLSDTFKQNLKKNLNTKFLAGINYQGEIIVIDDFVSNLSADTSSIDELRKLELNSRLSGSLDEMSKTELSKLIKDIYVNTKTSVERKTLVDQINKNSELSEVGWDWGRDKDTQEKIYGGGTSGAEGFESIPANSYVQGFGYNGKEYLLELKNDKKNEYSVKGVYSLDGLKDANSDNIASEINKKFSFKKYDVSSYNNKYENPELRYYETEPYKGLPAIVPFDLEHGWYASVSQTLPVLGSIGSYDESGRVTSFWVCNVGENREEENKAGDDICQMINTGTGQSYNQFYGLSESQAINLIRDANKAIEEASKKYKSGISGDVYINKQKVKIGLPAANVPDIQCQDFMSPKDCQLLFNVCDPVICPSSRCDLGGSYPVKDVVQSGIIGSIALCAPNFVGFGGDVYIPVCLTGVKAGIDGLLSVYTSYRDCLQESLNTGKMVGVCDEIYSIHLCEFFWRQSLPLAKIIVPKMIELVFGQNVRGGGEYLGVASAWSNAESSVNYFTQYYALNSYKAFKARNAEEVGGEVCKNFVSAVYPKTETLLDSLTEPDSPPQFHGTFDEIPFTSATVPPISHYKVFYHIYSGNDAGVYYKVYLKGASESSFYQDTSLSRIVASGYIRTGGYASETKDFTAPSGYKEMCIMVNEQEECGFKQVSTSYAVNYVKDKYMEEQLKKKDIKTEKECVSGSVSAYSLLNPNVQEGVGDLISPEIYNRGIIRICATSNPGKGTDESWNTENARWKPVGYCGTSNIKCWLDTESVEDVIQHTDIEKGILEEQTKNYLEILKTEGNYIDDFPRELKEIDKLDDSKKISRIGEILDKVFYNYEKAKLFLLRGIAYGKLAFQDKSEIDKRKQDEKAQAEAERLRQEQLKKEQEGKASQGVVESVNGDTADDSGKEVEQEGPILPSPTQLESRFNGEPLKKGILEHDSIIKEMSSKYDVSESLIKAIITQESYWAESKTDGKGSFGLMQVSADATNDVGLYDKFKNNLVILPENNIEIGTAYYAHLRDTYYKDSNSGENLNKITLAAYNWGLSNVNKNCKNKKWENCKNIPSEVLQYVSNVIAYEKKFLEMEKESSQGITGSVE